MNTLTSQSSSYSMYFTGILNSSRSDHNSTVGGSIQFVKQRCPSVAFVIPLPANCFWPWASRTRRTHAARQEFFLLFCHHAFWLFESIILFQALILIVHIRRRFNIYDIWFLCDTDFTVSKATEGSEPSVLMTEHHTIAPNVSWSQLRHENV